MRAAPAASGLPNVPRNHFRQTAFAMLRVTIDPLGKHSLRAMYDIALTVAQGSLCIRFPAGRVTTRQKQCPKIDARKSRLIRHLRRRAAQNGTKCHTFRG
jgi:hypothetical protein